MVRAFVNGEPVTDVDLMKIYKPMVDIYWKIMLQYTEKFTLVTKYHLNSLAAIAVPLRILLKKATFLKMNPNLKKEKNALKEL